MSANQSHHLGEPASKPALFHVLRRGPNVVTSFPFNGMAVTTSDLQSRHVTSVPGAPEHDLAPCRENHLPSAKDSDMFKYSKSKIASFLSCKAMSNLELGYNYPC